MVGRTHVPVVLALVPLVSIAPPSVDGATARQATISGLNPGEVNHGDTAQTIHAGGQVPGDSTTLTIDVTPLSEAGVDLSSATVSVNRSPGDVRTEATMERTDDSTLVHVDFEAGGGPSAFRLALRLEGLETAGASQTWLRYDASTDDERIQSDRFRLERPAMPDLVAEVESVPPVVERRDESLRLAVDDALPETPVRLWVDLAPLRRANVSLVGIEASAEVTAGESTLQSVGVNGSTALLRGRTGSGDFAEYSLVLSGLDTRRAEPTGGLRLPITIEAPAGTKTTESSPFGLYRPGEAPAPTETIVESPTATGTSTPAATASVAPGSTAGVEPDDGQPGFSTGATLLALLVAVALAGHRRP